MKGIWSAKVNEHYPENTEFIFEKRSKWTGVWEGGARVTVALQLQHMLCVVRFSAYIIYK